MSNTLTESTNVTLSIRTVVALLCKRIVPILLCAVICGLSALLYYSFFVSAQYTATVSIIADNRTIGTPDSAALSLKSTSDITASRLLTDSYIAIFSTSSFLESVAGNVNDTSDIILDGEVAQLNGAALKSMVKMAAVNNTEILEIKVSSSSPQLSVDICYAIVEQAKIVLAETMDQSQVKSVEGNNIQKPSRSSSPSPYSRMIAGFIIGLSISSVVVIASYVIKCQYSAKEAPDSAKAAGTTPADQNLSAGTPAQYQATKVRTRPRPQRQAPTAPKQ